MVTEDYWFLARIDRLFSGKKVAANFSKLAQRFFLVEAPIFHCIPLFFCKTCILYSFAKPDFFIVAHCSRITASANMCFSSHNRP